MRPAPTPTRRQSPTHGESCFGDQAKPTEVTRSGTQVGLHADGPRFGPQAWYSRWLGSILITLDSIYDGCLEQLGSMVMLVITVHSLVVYTNCVFLKESTRA